MKNFKRGKQFLILFFLMTGFVKAQTIINGHNIIDASKMRFLTSEKDSGKITMNQVDDEQIFTVTTSDQPQFIYQLANKIPTKHTDFSKDQVFLLSFQAKTVFSSLETGEAKMLWLFRQSESYQDNLTSTLSISSDWQEYFIPFQATRDISKDDFRLVLQYGFKPQEFLIKDIKFQVYPKGTEVTSLPKTKISYAGMEADAEWRQKANERIEMLRKGKFTVQLLKDGQPAAHQNISIKLVKHAFPFGAAMDAQDIVEGNLKYENFKKAFHYTVLANDLKIKAWNRENKRKVTLEALDVLEKDDIDVKGHVLIWPGFQYLTPEVRQNRDNPEKVTEIVETHVHNLLEVTKGRIFKWDVVNEAYTNKDLQKITGSEQILYDGFKAAKKHQPLALRYTNEYGIISKGGIDTKKQQWYYDFIKRIDTNTGGLVQGIGIQCHIGSDLTPPERVLELLNYYASLGKQIGVSEFTMDVQDPEIREQYTRDFMIAAFSHPYVSEFLFWGCTDDDRDKVDIYTEDGQIGVMGKAFFSLVHEEWKTNVYGETNENGEASGRGFFGTYEYSFVQDGKVIKGTFDLLPRKNSTFKINI
ncbi:endo-1,4-beta-xylanase [Mangrovimonas sp. AS39]|uniref:endo-1,4-beta-xylanase n=1 Tax=Mangrovimonas futianensis TaxID=2895523 RepID=UPI001E31BEFC|nr:endo-1,4-beta-xylanase [Mangrovimonas futianensis]MCF1191039.1 endo-1,4-beta-xylanase [Mangrovimonas futianensis]MCF1194734.1 endo-1,4-beta-xylanase [Mangrovimonas futianensis]